VLELSVDVPAWELLTCHRGEGELNCVGTVVTFPIATEARYRFVRLLQTGKNSNNNYYFPLLGLELYGTLFPDKPEAIPLSAGAGAELLAFECQHDMDTHGILYHLAT
jgi:hypothetical protein